MQSFYRPLCLSGEVRAQIDSWGRQYARLLRRDSVPAKQRREQMNRVNPAYVLRNYLVQEAIDLWQKGDSSMLENLYRMLHEPYESRPEFAGFAQKRPEWARDRAGCSMLSCSS